MAFAIYDRPLNADSRQYTIKQDKRKAGMTSQTICLLLVAFSLIATRSVLQHNKNENQ
jgi:hypothetical protein